MDKVIFINITVSFALCFLLPIGFTNKIRECVGELLRRRKMRIAAIYTFIFMIAAHLYAWLNGSLLFDAASVYRGINEKIFATDKWVQQFVWVLDAGINSPWLAGILSICTMIVSVCCIIDVLDVDSKIGIALVAGLCSVNSSIISHQTYTGGSYVAGIALAFACIAVWMGKRLKNINIYLKTMIVAIFIALSAGMYGSYVSMVPSLLLVILIFDIFDGKTGKTNWKNAFIYLFQFATGMLLYYLILRIIMFCTGTQLSSYMGEDVLNDTSGFHNMLKCIPEAYKYLFGYYRNGLYYLPHFMSVLLFIIMLAGSLLTIIWVYRKRNCFKDRKLNLPLLLLILSILPMAINLIYIMSVGNVHYLMIFTYVVPLLFFVRILEDIWKDANKEENVNYKNKRLVVFTISLFSVFMYYSVVMANAVYINYHNMYDVSLSIGTRILDRIENCEGFEGTEKIILVGDIQYNSYFGEVYEESEILDAFLGCGNPNNKTGLCYGAIAGRYLRNVLDSKLEYLYCFSIDGYISENNLSSEEIEKLNEMQVFPQKESVKKIGNKIYVKFSDS